MNGSTKDSSNEIMERVISGSSPTSKAMDRTTDSQDGDALGEMINEAAMSILDGEDFTVEPTQIKTRAGKKKDHVKRPMNAFMVYAQVARKLISKSNSTLQNSEISKKLGELWRRTDEASKRAFIEKAELLRQNHKKEHPDYKYQPRRKKSKTATVGGSSANGSGGHGRSRSPTGAIDSQNPIKTRVSKSKSKGSSSANIGGGGATVIAGSVGITSPTGFSPTGSLQDKLTKSFDVEKVYNYCGPMDMGSKLTAKDPSLCSSVSSQAYSNYLYGFPGKPYQSRRGQTTAMMVPSSPADSQASVHSNLSTPPTTPLPSANVTSTRYRTESSSSPSNISVVSRAPYAYEINPYAIMSSCNANKEMNNQIDDKGIPPPEAVLATQDSPMGLTANIRSIDWYSKYDEQCSADYGQPPAPPSAITWHYSNGGGYTHPSAVAAGAAPHFVADVDPNELEQYLDNPAAARKVPSSVYTSHTRDEMLLDLQPTSTATQNSHSTSNIGCLMMQNPSVTTQQHNHNHHHHGGISAHSAAVGTIRSHHSTSDYYMNNGGSSAGSGGYDSGYNY